MGAFDQLYEGGASAEVRSARRPAQRRRTGPLRRRFTEAVQQLASVRATVGDIAATPARLRRRHQRLARAPGRNRRPPRAHRPPQAQIRPDRRRGHRLRRRRSPQAGRSRRPRRNPQDPPRRPRKGCDGISKSRRRAHRRAQGRRRQARQARRSADQLPGHEGQIRSRRACRRASETALDLRRLGRGRVPHLHQPRRAAQAAR